MVCLKGKATEQEKLSVPAVCSMGAGVTISGVLRECGASFGSAGDYERAKRSLMDCLARLMWPPEPCL